MYPTVDYVFVYFVNICFLLFCFLLPKSTRGPHPPVFTYWNSPVLVSRPPGIPPRYFLQSVGSFKGEPAVQQKVIQESARAEAFTVLNCGAGRRSVNVGHWPLSGLFVAPLMGQAPPAPSLVSTTHKGAQEDGNQDEWPFFSSHSTLIRAFHLLCLHCYLH